MGQFIVHRVEHEHGEKLIRNAYQTLRKEEIQTETEELSPVEGW